MSRERRPSIVQQNIYTSDICISGYIRIYVFQRFRWGYKRSCSSANYSWVPTIKSSIFQQEDTYYIIYVYAWLDCFAHAQLPIYIVYRSSLSGKSLFAESAQLDWNTWIRWEHSTGMSNLFVCQVWLMRDVRLLSVLGGCVLNECYL